jgi:hypothetical protein
MADDRRKRGHKKTKRMITKENEEEKAERQIKNRSKGKKENERERARISTTEK